ncbi:hypothetical protein MAPG_09461 [Magnaporthiopsis poae ATCC 64411]|uniref:Uncharacterized protein n=1 Tax=Magnaporthiopsis poae (strain ATCC 64411 / 73-15) TaxID=644358 RepID=A0A0C4EA07_MAGP6|nr:hypothetical protein MAPG_09461 [Magnaporthiopsis poae ATCC 64411]
MTQFLTGDLEVTCLHNLPGDLKSVAECECKSASLVRQVHSANCLLADLVRELHSELDRLKDEVYKAWIHDPSLGWLSRQFLRLKAAVYELWPQGPDHTNVETRDPCRRGIFYLNFTPALPRRQLKAAEAHLEGYREVRRKAARKLRDKFMGSLIMPNGAACALKSVLEAQEGLLGQLDELACFRLGPDSYLLLTELCLRCHLVAVEERFIRAQPGEDHGVELERYERFSRELRELCTDAARDRLLAMTKPSILAYLRSEDNPRFVGSLCFIEYPKKELTLGPKEGPK